MRRSWQRQRRYTPLFRPAHSKRHTAKSYDELYIMDQYCQVRREREMQSLHPGAVISGVDVMALERTGEEMRPGCWPTTPTRAS
jgi:hypothetical protein